MKKTFSGIEIVTVSVFLLSGDSKHVSTEDVAIKANQLAPNRFNWKKYEDQIDLETIKKRLFESKSKKNRGYLYGSHKKGWILSEKGYEFCQKNLPSFKGADLTKSALNNEEERRKNAERDKMLKSVAFKKIKNNNSDLVTVQEAESFFRMDDYVLGNARSERIARIKNIYSDDPELGEIVSILAKKVRKI